MAFTSSHSRTGSHNRFGFAQSRRRLGVLLVAILALGAVGVGQAESAQAADPVASVSTTTEASFFMNPQVYGQALALTAIVKPDGPAVALMGSAVQLVVDGVSVGEGILLYIGEGKFWTIILAEQTLPAGTHTVVARFPGISDSDPLTPDVLPSESDPVTVTIAQAPTTTTITSAPASITAFAPIDVTASVTTGPSGLGGSATLLADGAPLATKDLEADGTVLFDDVHVPFGTAALSVAYLGDASGNYAPSESVAFPVIVKAAATETALGLSSQHVTASESVTFVVTVRNVSGASLVDPGNGFEIVIDDEVFYSEVSSDDGDPVDGDGTAQFEVELSHLPIGSHTVSARFLPASGFGDSESELLDLRVDPIVTALTPEQYEVQGTPKHPAVVTVTVDTTPAAHNPMNRLSAANELVDGYVQAFLDGEAIGTPFAVVAGKGSGLLSGLPLGKHEVELRFSSDNHGVLSSSAVVSVTIAADLAAGGDARPSALSSTGAPAPSPLVGAVLVMLLGVGALMVVVSRRRLS